MYYDSANAMQRCRACGHRIAFAQETLEQAQRRRAAAGTTRSGAPPLTMRGPVDARARSIYESGHAFLNQGDRDEALLHFRRAAAAQPDFVDAHLWIARLTDNPDGQRDALSAILAHDPGHPNALRMLLVLNGELTEAEAARTYHADEVTTVQVQGAATPLAAVACPVCGGQLAAEADPERPGRMRALCAFCGHHQPIEAQAESASLGMAMLKQKARPVRWAVESLAVRCSACGAERTLPPARMTHECPFCGADHVVRLDALGEHAALQQPDGVVPFTLRAADARALLQERLKGLDQRIAGWFNDNRIADLRIEPVYLPFWLFDALLTTTVTITEQPSAWEDKRQARRTPLMRTYQQQDGALDVLVPAFTTPDPRLASEAARCDLSAQVGYDPRLLAQIPAALYTLPFDTASLEARTRAAARVREQHLAGKRGEDEMRVTPLVVSMTFSLVLVPMWLATLLERDGDQRSAIVNGQSGAVALGAAQRARRDARKEKKTP